MKRERMVKSIALMTACVLILGGCAADAPADGTTKSTTATTSAVETSAATTTTTTTEPATTATEEVTTTSTTVTTTVTTKTTATTRPIVQDTVVDLMSGAKAQPVSGTAPDEAFAAASMAFALKLFQQTNKTTDENVLVSPLSAQLGLAMVANGADGKTLQEIEAALGMGIPDLNAYLYAYVNSLPTVETCQVEIANSLWVRKGLSVKQSFLNNTATYYDAQVYQTPFTEDTVDEINEWVERETNSLIDTITDDIDPNAYMYLINTVAFDATWRYPFLKSNTAKGVFTAENGAQRTVDMMKSRYETNYLDDGRAVGFIKGYKGANYSFAVLLPNEDITIDEYIAGLTPETMLETLSSADRKVAVVATVPKFSYDCDMDLKQILRGLGVESAFLPSADFSNMARGLYVGEASQKTVISVNEDGTTAAAVSSYNEIRGVASAEIVLDRPFVYMIVDNTTNLPIFIGAVKDIT